MITAILILLFAGEFVLANESDSLRTKDDVQEFLVKVDSYWNIWPRAFV